MPHSSRISKIIRYGLVILVIVILSGLTWWYYFLRAQEDTLRSSDIGRGAGISPPSFGEAIGSTYNNIVESLSSLAGGTRVSEEGALPRLRQITRAPVAGAGFITRV